MSNSKGFKYGFYILLAIVVIGAGYGLATMPDDRSAVEHISDAAAQLDEGVDDAARELKDSTPLERAQDEVEDSTDGSPQ